MSGSQIRERCQSLFFSTLDLLLILLILGHARHNNMYFHLPNSP